MADERTTLEKWVQDLDLPRGTFRYPSQVREDVYYVLEVIMEHMEERYGKAGD